MAGIARWEAERPSNRMIQQTQFASGKPAEDPRNAAVVLESRGLKKIYGSGEKSISVLADANLSLRQGEMVAIVAPSGAGKSTLLHLLAALDTPTSGTVYFATKAIESIDDAEVARGGWLGKSGRSPPRGTLRRGTAARRDCRGARHWAVSAAGR